MQSPLPVATSFTSARVGGAAAPGVTRTCQPPFGLLFLTACKLLTLLPGRASSSPAAAPVNTSGGPCRCRCAYPTGGPCPRPASCRPAPTPVGGSWRRRESRRRPARPARQRLLDQRDSASATRQRRCAGVMRHQDRRITPAPRRHQAPAHRHAGGLGAGVANGDVLGWRCAGVAGWRPPSRDRLAALLASRRLAPCSLDC